MIKKISQVVLFLFIAFSFQFCVDEELQNPQPDDDASRRRLKPRANAGSDIAITLPTNVAKLDGSKSKDSLGVIKSYLWQKVAGPASSTITSPTAAITDAKDLTEGTYTFRLKVTNDRNVSAYDDVVVTVSKSLTQSVTQPTTTTATTATPLFTGIMNSATYTKFSDWCSIQPWLDDLKKLGFSIGSKCASSYLTVEKVIDNGVSVLKARIIGKDPYDAGRFQTETYFPSRDLGIYHHSQRMKFHPDVAYISQYPTSLGGNSWFTIFETWMGNSVVRQSLYMTKDLKWNLVCEWEEGSSTPYQKIWTQTNTTTPIPMGKWFTMDVYIKSGEGSNGQLKITITVDGEAPVVIFDVRNTTTVPGQPTIYRRKTDHMKFYIGPALRDFMLNANKALEVSYGDYIIYKD